TRRVNPEFATVWTPKGPSINPCLRNEPRAVALDRPAGHAAPPNPSPDSGAVRWFRVPSARAARTGRPYRAPTPPAPPAVVGGATVGGHAGRSAGRGRG